MLPREQPDDLIVSHHFVGGTVLARKRSDRFALAVKLGKHRANRIEATSIDAAVTLFLRDENLVHLLTGADARDHRVDVPVADERTGDVDHTRGRDAWDVGLATP